MPNLDGFLTPGAAIQTRSWHPATYLPCVGPRVLAAEATEVVITVTQEIKRLGGLVLCAACAGPQATPAEPVPPPCVAAAHTLPGGYCADATAQDRLATLDRLPRPLRVDPLQRDVTAGKLHPRSVLVGAAIVLPAPESLSAAWLQRVLTCHEADVALGTIAASPDDPFSDPAAWLTISAYPQGGTLVVRIEPTDESQAKGVFDQANRWAGRHGSKP